MIASADGCRGGWIVSQTEGWPLQTPTFSFFATFSEVVKATAKCEFTMIDMPIGLPRNDYPRLCDSEARQILNGAQSRLFYTPPRKTLKCESWETFLAEHRRITGVGASIQVWSILPKIREIDEQLTSDPQKQIREFHPELTWKHLASRTLPSKHSAVGLLERIAVLERRGVTWLREIPHESLPKNVASDDLLDAIVGLDAADRIIKNHPRRLPKNGGKTDEKGLTMEIWY